MLVILMSVLVIVMSALVILLSVFVVVIMGKLTPNFEKLYLSKFL